MVFYKNLLHITKQRFSGFAARPWLNVSEEVKTAVFEKRGVVALESTVITHGMPYPANLKVAQELENLVRQYHCVPATVALFNGKIHVGLNDNQLNLLATSQSAQKVSRRDLTVTLSKKSIGSTTVSATMIAAHLSGISIFATGGIGGVHRGFEETFDISADLTELGRTPVAVVCAGVKSILDIPKTLEYLETQGVPVITFGDNNDFPGFFTRNSGCKSPYNLNNENDIASVIHLSEKMNLSNGLLIAVPIPENETSSGKIINEAIEKALIEAKNLKITGRDITPFILKKVNELTKGLSLNLNTILIKNNAMHAAKVAHALSLLKENQFESEPEPINSSNLKNSENIKSKDSKQTDVVVVGGTIVDFYLKTDDDIKMDGRTHPGFITQVCGGVGRNHADALTRLGLNTLLISACGDDELKTYIQNSCSHMDLQGIQLVKGQQTASYAGIVAKSTLLYGIGDMDLFKSIDRTVISRFEETIGKCKMCIIDGNISAETISYICDICISAQVPVWFDPADCSKVTKIFDAQCWDKISYFSPNWNEFLYLNERLGLTYDDDCFANHSILYEKLMKDTKRLLTSVLQGLVITLGPQGVVLIRKSKENGRACITHFKAPFVERLINVSGGGDCLNSGIIYGLLNRYSWQESIRFGLHCASKSLQSFHPVPTDLNLLNFANVSPAVILYDQEFSL